MEALFQFSKCLAKRPSKIPVRVIAANGIIYLLIVRQNIKQNEYKVY